MPSDYGDLMRPELLWTPAADAATTTELGRFLRDVGGRTGHGFDTYEQAWKWSANSVPLDDCFYFRLLTARC